MSEKLSTQFGESYDSLMRPTEGQWEYWTLRIAALETENAALKAKLEAVKQIMYHTNDDMASRLANALGIIRKAKQKQDDEDHALPELGQSGLGPNV